MTEQEFDLDVAQAQLQTIKDTISDDTVLVIVADHGHVDRGGHGGTASELLDVPLPPHMRMRLMAV